MLPPFSTGNTIGSGVFPDATTAGMKVDKNVANIWSTTPGVAEARPVQPVDRRPTWSYQAGQQVPEYQPSWASYQGGHHMQEAHAWNEQAYGRNGGQQPGVWNYPAEGYQQPSAGYYYVPHQRQEEYIIPYDIGARRGGAYPPAPPGYPLPPHMQYYGTTSSHQVSPSSPPYTVAAPHTMAAPSVVAPTVAPVVAPTHSGASFLFEAATAAAAAAASTVEAPKSPVVESKEKRVTAASSAGGRVNNHQVRLHSSGNEKAPLATAPVHAASVTTLMIRNIPNRYSQSELLMEIREAGFDAKFDFFYLPMDHETHANFGYAFINFVDEREVEPFTKRFNGLKLNRFTSNKIIQIVPAQLQGFQANLQHYCKKAVCTDDNIDYRPLFFVDGKCLEFHRASDFADAVKAKNESIKAKEDRPREERTEKPNHEERPRIERGGNKVFQKRRS